MFRKNVEIEFESNKNYVLQPMNFNWRNIKAAYKLVRDWSIMRYFCAIPCIEGNRMHSKALNFLIAIMVIKELTHEPYNYVIIYKPTDDVAACIVLRPRKMQSGLEGQDLSTLSISIATFSEYRRRGLIHEGQKMAIQIAFKNQEVKKIEALTLPENKISQGLIKRYGFDYEGVTSTPNTWFREKDRNDIICWGLSREKAEMLGLVLLL